MEKEQLDDVMYESVAKTLESMTFTEVLPTNLDMVVTGNEYGVALNVLEPYPGLFQMIISHELLYVISEALFTLPREEIKEESLLDFSSELLNTIVGSFLNAALPDGIKLRLGLPERIRSNGLSETDSVVRWNFNAEETIFSISASGQLAEFLSE